jgi:hypothetical protein
VGFEKEAPYDLSPAARYRTVDGCKNCFLKHQSLYAARRLLEVYFRREMMPETDELMFRLRHIALAGEAPKFMMEFPKSKHIGAWIAIYDYWYQAQREADPGRRQEMAWTALYWFLELGLRLAGTNNIDEFVQFSVGTEIIGEFELMGEDQGNFLRHLKRFVMHASVSYCKKMMADPIQIVPFSERNMPGYEEYQAFVRSKFA